ncbi:MAG: Gfo/Idh/MocA family oxidoreductase [Lentisphaeria bacterium]|nr:Gfo/Idh/MocA family oxidoreductase [Lentisphaeria bacterium]
MAVKFIVLGFGFMGQTHAGNILKHPAAELAAIVDPYSPMDRLATIRGNKNTVTITVNDVKEIPHYTTIEEAFQNVEADAVIIALPTLLHYPSVMSCLKQGLHVLVEKPFATKVEECEQMVQAAREKEKVLAVGYVVRCMREYMILRDYIREGTFGKPELIMFSRITGIPAWGNWKDPEFIKASGGALFDLFSHDADITRFCLGEPSEILTDNVLCSKFNGNMISATFRYPACDVRIDGGFVTPSPYPFNRHYSAFFENGTLLCEGTTLKFITQDGIKQIDLADDNPYYRELSNFITAIQTGDESGICTGADAAHSIECCTQIADMLK